MVGLLYFLALVIFFHNGLVLFSQFLKPVDKRDIFSVLVEGVMATTSILAIFSENWCVLIVGFSIYRIIIQSIAVTASLQHQRPLPLLLWADILLVSGGVIAGVSEYYWIFALFYLIHWVLSYLIVRKALASRVPFH